MSDSPTPEEHTTPASDQESQRRVTLRRADLELVAFFATARLSDADAERQRVERLDEVHEAGRLLARRLSRLLAHSVTESRGSHSRWHLPADASEFFDALVHFADLVRGSATHIRTQLPNGSCDDATAPREEPARPRVRLVD